MNCGEQSKTGREVAEENVFKRLLTIIHAHVSEGFAWGIAQWSFDCSTNQTSSDKLRSTTKVETERSNRLTNRADALCDVDNEILLEVACRKQNCVVSADSARWAHPLTAFFVLEAALSSTLVYMANKAQQKREELANHCHSLC